MSRFKEGNAMPVWNGVLLHSAPTHTSGGTHPWPPAFLDLRAGSPSCAPYRLGLLSLRAPHHWGRLSGLTGLALILSCLL